MLLKISTNNIEHQRKRIEITSCVARESEDHEKIILLFTTSKNHKLLEGDRLFFKGNTIVCKSYNDIIPSFYDEGDIIEFEESCWNTNSDGVSTFYEKGLYIKEKIGYRKLSNEEVENYCNQIYSLYGDNIKVVGDNLTPTTFQVVLNKYVVIQIKEVVDTNEDTYAYPDKELTLNLTVGDKINLYEKIGNVYYTIDGCKYLNKHAFTSPLGFIDNSHAYYILDDRFVNYIDGDEGVTLEFKRDILVYEYSESLNISIPLSDNVISNISHEDSINNYFNAKRAFLIPDIIDYEKKCFTPVYYYNKKYYYVNEMQFNLFFRDRSGSDEWLTADNKGWNQYRMNDNGTFNTPSTYSGDLIGVLNFNDNDIYYRKKKVSKSFLRLSFYDSTDPSTQMLLYYSTIFMDSADYYNKYVSYFRNNPTVSKDSVTLVNRETDDANRLGINFIVKDKYDKNKSSEGFYVYLFPDGLREFGDNDNTLGEWDYNNYSSVERTIYMKVEFNHAGYGRTIPLMYPLDKTGNVLSFSSTGFPKSFGGNWKTCNESMYIPVKIKYDSENNDFVYYFPYCKRTNNKLEFNLYEPRLNDLE